jgi:cyanophycinase
VRRKEELETKVRAGSEALNVRRKRENVVGSRIGTNCPWANSLVQRPILYLLRTKVSKALCPLLLLAVIQACGPAETEVPDENVARSGRLVIVGGALQADNVDVYSAVLRARAGDGPLCVVPTASSDPVEAMSGAVQTLTEYGGRGSAKGILLSVDDPEGARDPAIASELAGCSGFYFTGGSQSRILDVFLPEGDTTEAYRALWRRWREGAVVAGSSAGAAMMSRVMISGGGSDEAVAHGVASGPGADGVQIRPGMGFFEPMLDQHFLARGRIGRLIVAVIHQGAPPIGMGIDENTALVVEGDSATVVGASGVVVVDGRSAQATESNRALGLTVRLAGAGDVIDLSTFEVRRGSSKTALPLGAVAFQAPADPFARWAFLHVVQDLASSPASEVTFDLSGVTLRIVEAGDFSAAVSGMSGGVQESPLGLSAGPFHVDLVGPRPTG